MQSSMGTRLQKDFGVDLFFFFCLLAGVNAEVSQTVNVAGGKLKFLLQLYDCHHYNGVNGLLK